MTSHISAAGNTVVPALLALEALGFRVEVTAGAQSSCQAFRGDESYSAGDPVTVLGLVRLVELRSWDWEASDRDIDLTLNRFALGG
ncbi:MAG: hypothetical protein JWO05_3147 [Gemmatimonadetes bacterium]|nr:hypothetical protein [Gemmatimonadota bacterium]